MPRTRSVRTTTIHCVVASVAIVAPLFVFAPPAHADTPTSVVTWVNGLRSSTGLAPLAVDTQLSSVAQQWATHLASTGVLIGNPA